jgi:hypothetical protein
MTDAIQSPILVVTYRESTTTTVAVERRHNAPSFWDTKFQLTVGTDSLGSLGADSTSLLLSFRPDGSL